MKLTGRPTTEQIAQLLANPVDPDEKIRRRLRMELHRLVNHAALFGVEIPAPLPTEEEQIAACQGIMPLHIRKRWKAENSAMGIFDPYGDLRTVRGGGYRGD